MANRPTFASVTDRPCACGYLQQAADDPDNPIAYDGQVGEYLFTGAGHKLTIYHCPFCGGAAPESKRHLLFAVIPQDEEARLSRLLAPVRTVRSALKCLGTPDRDEAAGTRTSQAEVEGQPPVKQHHRTLVYKRLSEVADVWITERQNGQVHWQLVGKYIG